MQGPARDWAGLDQFPGPTKSAITDALSQLRSKDKTSLTILLLGKGGVGKSSTINSLVGERVVSVSAFQSEPMRPQLVTRVHSGFSLSFIDTPSLVEAGGVNDTALSVIKRSLEGVTIDVLLYVDRLDGYRVDTLDRQVIRAITEGFSPKIWRVALLVLTHGQLSQPPDGISYADFVARRAALLQDVVRQEAGLRKSEVQVPVTLAENGTRCKKNLEGEKILPDGTVWTSKLFGAIADVATGRGVPLLVDKKILDGPNHNGWGKILIPVLLALQYFFVVKPLQQLIEKDVREEEEDRPTWEKRAERYEQLGKQAEALKKMDNYKAK